MNIQFVRLAQDVCEAVNQRALESRRTVSELVNEILRQHLASDPPRPNANESPHSLDTICDPIIGGTSKCSPVEVRSSVNRWRHSRIHRLGRPLRTPGLPLGNLGGGIFPILPEIPSSAPVSCSI